MSPLSLITLINFRAELCSVRRGVLLQYTRAPPGRHTWGSLSCCTCFGVTAVCCSVTVLQCGALCCGVLQSVTECCGVLHRVWGVGSVLQCVAVCCSAQQCLAARVCCNVVHCVAQGFAYCVWTQWSIYRSSIGGSVLQCVAVCVVACRTLKCMNPPLLAELGNETNPHHSGMNPYFACTCLQCWCSYVVINFHNFIPHYFQWTCRRFFMCVREWASAWKRETGSRSWKIDER